MTSTNGMKVFLLNTNNNQIAAALLCFSQYFRSTFGNFKFWNLKLHSDLLVSNYAQQYVSQPIGFPQKRKEPLEAVGLPWCLLIALGFCTSVNAWFCQYVIAVHRMWVARLRSSFVHRNAKNYPNIECRASICSYLDVQSNGIPSWRLYI